MCQVGLPNVHPCCFLSTRCAELLSFWWIWSKSSATHGNIWMFPGVPDPMGLSRHIKNFSNVTFFSSEMLLGPIQMLKTHCGIWWCRLGQKVTSCLLFSFISIEISCMSANHSLLFSRKRVNLENRVFNAIIQMWFANMHLDGITHFLSEACT